ncbi:MAG TPA: hypothetical protein DHV42_07515 [Lachnospiraceae bacterium]|nr:hypothetical protein [Lachnospiraceae bacterium]
MRIDCEVIRDLLPLYADNACSGKSRLMIEEHLAECSACCGQLEQIRKTEIDDSLREEKTSVIQYGENQLRRRSAVVGSAMSGLFMIPILIYLVVNIYTGSSLGVFFVVLASILVAASLIVVPMMVPEDKAFWTFCAFCASLMLLLAVTSLYSHGRWFWIASSATLFGLGVVFLPFLVRAKPARKMIGNSNPVVIVIGIDVLLFINMMNMIARNGKLTIDSILFTLGILAGIVVIASKILKKNR